ncbi:hypothetical protein [Sphingobacterium faecium]|uniref:hypothetical protein n=1 Tax=Sphingobacterium faecium TaxID=34087 RepID=UPI003208A333
MKKQNIKTEVKEKKKTSDTHAQTKVKSDTGTRPSKDTNPLPPNPNEVDNHEDA